MENHTIAQRKGITVNKNSYLSNKYSNVTMSDIKRAKHDNNSILD